MPGVFAAGDVRLDSMKRVASAVGEARCRSSRAPLPGDDLMQLDDLWRSPPAAAVHRRATDRCRPRRRGRRVVPGDELFGEGQPAERPVGAAGRDDRAGPASAGRTPWRWTMAGPPAGRAVPGPGTRTAPTWRPAVRPGQAECSGCRPRCCGFAEWFRRCAPDPAASTTRPRSIESTARQRQLADPPSAPAAGLADDQQPGVGGAPRRRRAAARRRRHADALAGLAGTTSPPPSSARWTAAGRASAAGHVPTRRAEASGPRGRTANWLATRGSPGWRLAAAPRRGRRPAWCDRVEAVLRGEDLHPALEWVANTVASSGCWPRSASRPTGCPSWCRRCAPTPRWIARPGSGSTRSAGWRTPW